MTTAEKRTVYNLIVAAKAGIEKLRMTYATGGKPVQTFSDTNTSGVDSFLTVITNLNTRITNAEGLLT